MRTASPLKKRIDCGSKILICEVDKVALKAGAWIWFAARKQNPPSIPLKQEIDFVNSKT